MGLAGSWSLIKLIKFYLVSPALLPYFSTPNIYWWRTGSSGHHIRLSKGKVKVLYAFIYTLLFPSRDLEWFTGTSLVALWLRMHLPKQGTRVQSLVREDPTCHGATKPVRHNYWACSLEPASHNYWACMPQLLKPAWLEPVPCNKEKPPQWEAHAPQWRVAPARRN